MPVLYPLVGTTEMTHSVLATGVFAMGDARYYARKAFPASIQRGALNTFAPLRIQDIAAYFVALSTITESKLQAITMSIYFDTTKTDIPQSDPDAEFKIHALLSTVDNAEGQADAFQIEIPNTQNTTAIAAWVATNANLIFHPTTGVKANGLIVANSKPDRRARG